MTLVDCSPGMLAMSRQLNPECEHIEGDMRTVRLGRQYDAVFVHDAICYMTSEADLRQAIETAFVHCKPGGVALFAPTTFARISRQEPNTAGMMTAREECAGSRGSGIPIPTIRRISWTTPISCVSATGRCASSYDRHVEGLFPRDTWLQLFKEVGFTA